MLYRTLVKPLLFALDAETAHNTAFCALRMLECAGPLRGALAGCYRADDPALECERWGLKFKNPVGLAAGFDKNALAPNALAAFGFGFIECGTVTAQAQAGNAGPRLMRLPEYEALINRLGFNNEGAEAVADRLKNHALPALPVGLNIGKSKATPLDKAVDDYLFSFEKLYPYASYFTVNVSSPNTPGLRELQHDLGPLLSALQSKNAKRKPILVKIAPDLISENLDAIAQVCAEHGISGIIATNTTISRDGVSLKQPMEGGLSGRPLFARSTDVLRQLYRRVGKQIPLVGVGGIFSAEDAYEKIRAGASLVQVYTGWIYRGPGMIRDINRGLAELLRRDGLRNVDAAVGVDA